MNNPPNSATCIRLVHGLTVEENGWSGFGQSAFIKWKLHKISLKNTTSTKRENYTNETSGQSTWKNS